VGRIVSFCFHCPGACSVTVAGDFNNWDVSTHAMVYDSSRDLWTVALSIEPGRYEYKYFVDGQVWWNDPFAPKIPNAWGSENSYLDVE